MYELPPVLAADVFKDLINAGTLYLECREREITKRERIAAELEAKLALINANYNLYSQFLAENHALAMRAYQVAEEMLKEPAVLENSDRLKLVLTFLSNAHAQSSGNLAAMLSNLKLG